MMKNTLFLFLMLVFAIAVQAQPRVQVIHNSPTPGTTSGPAVDIYINGALLPELTNVAYRTASPYLDAPSGVEVNVGVALAGSGSVNDTLVNFNLGVLPDTLTFTVVASGIVGNPTRPFFLFANADAREAPIGAPINVNVFHGSTDAPNVDIFARRFGLLIPDLAYGEFTDYIPLDPALGSLALDIRAANMDPIVGTFGVPLAPLNGQAVTVFASGLLGDTPAFGLFAAFPNGSVVALPQLSFAEVQLLHNSPTPGLDSVDVYVNGILTADNINFREGSPYLNVPSGDVIVGFAPDTSTSVGDAIFFDTLTVENGDVVQAFASGILGNMMTPFEVLVNTNGNRLAAPPNAVRLNIHHGAPDAPPVNIAFRTFQGNVVDLLTYRDFTDYLLIPAGTYFIDVKDPSTGNVLVTYVAPLAGASTLNGTVFASGNFSGVDPAFGLFLLTSTGAVVELPTINLVELQIVHSSPAPTVDIYIDDVLEYDDVPYLGATPFDLFAVPASGDIDIKIAPGNSTSSADAIDSLTLSLTNGGIYQIFASGIAGDVDEPLDIYVNEDARIFGSTDDRFDAAIFHGAPGAGNVDVVNLLTGQEILVNFGLGSFSEYLSLDTTFQIFRVLTASGDVVTTSGGNFDGNFAGVVATVFAAREGGPTGDVRLFAVFTNGLVFPLPEFTAPSIQVIHNSPDPAVDVYIDDALALNDFAFRTATPFLTLFTGDTMNVKVAPGTSAGPQDAIFDADIPVIDGQEIIAMAHGVVNDPTTPFTVSLAPNVRTESVGGSTFFDFNVFHGSPDAPLVNILADDNPIYEDLTYGNFGDEYSSVPVDNYDIDLTDVDDNIIGSSVFNMDTLGGQAGIVFASGFFGGGTPGFNLWVALANGSTFPLDFIVSTENLNERIETLSLYPNPAVFESYVDVTFTRPVSQFEAMLFDATGKMVSTQSIGDLPAGKHQLRFDLSKLQAGSYFVTLLSAEGIATYPLQVMRP